MYKYPRQIAIIFAKPSNAFTRPQGQARINRIDEMQVVKSIMTRSYIPKANKQEE